MTAIPNPMRAQALRASSAVGAGSSRDAADRAITELLSLRAWVLHMADSIEALGELPARRRGKEAGRLAERMRHAVSAPHLVEACSRLDRGT